MTISIDASRVAVIIPCYNEAVTIAKVVADFRSALPGAPIYVYDNNSSDETAKLAKESGAIVRHEPRQGKGNVVRQMFRDIDADCYLMVDGDDTYPAEAAAALAAPILSGEADMTVGDRLSNGTYAEQNKRAFHGFGNDLVRTMIRWIYGYSFDDVMTGYRAMSRPFVKTFPVLSEGFQIETELSIHAVDRRWRIADVPIDYRDRPEGSESKLDTVGDGVKVVCAIASLFKNYRPLKFFSLIALVLALVGLILGLPVIGEFFATGLVPRLPTAVLAVAFMFLCGLSLATGLILDNVAKTERKEWELQVYRVFQEGRKN
ncbi:MULTISPECIES: glycosyltransferase family 2 protein [Collinsella]|uniref:glycosyltransferase family 2 protein n=1 Tax=Collinsella TaxID=102106 RepID=UPI001F172E35|nr:MULTISPECIES: glycosyltransferase family 2 protein [Collinsella]MDB1819252.1 glycosyltransferase family 2 protein [Collinsella aerofaciens]MDB1822980.1 glycosyltransferase family 2 protein [Collinsella aerofaciens]MDB1824855.1 glycosyltransferase family 2 protein [Collinsella aerofaciens]MDB1826728.1 glycosyltransferase family 2 protein [Collinsella aerofaciens]MDC0806975.1 glycosyltransferase family 2 protein [Collinsella aerofaciens]